MITITILLETMKTTEVRCLIMSDKFRCMSLARAKETISHLQYQKVSTELYVSFRRRDGLKGEIEAPFYRALIDSFIYMCVGASHVGAPTKVDDTFIVDRLR